MNEEFNIDPNDPSVDLFIRDSVSKMFSKYRKGELIKMEEPEIGVVKICIGFYPQDLSKQENLAFCVVKATMITESLNFIKVAEDYIMPLAIELGVEDAIIQELMDIKANKILGEENY